MFSDRAPLSFTLNFQNMPHNKTTLVNSVKYYKWNHQKRESFRRSIISELSNLNYIIYDKDHDDVNSVGKMITDKTLHSPLCSALTIPVLNKPSINNGLTVSALRLDEITGMP